MAESKLLIGKVNICEYLRIGKGRFLNLVRGGFPAIRENGKWVSHIDLIDDYFLDKIKAQMVYKKEEILKEVFDQLKINNHKNKRNKT